jgi:cobalt/nickel transport system permease protein
MHMADALISPAVGATMWAASAGLIGFSSKKVKEELDDRKIPLMGVVGAFIFAAQMINFAIPGTGSSGHLGGGMILAILLGPYAAFLTMASVLTVQALFFADGGLMALGCNIFNLGVFPCFIAYPLIYKKIVGDDPGQSRLFAGATISAILGLQLGALSVVFQTILSGISALSFGTFVLVMQPIHLAIGIVEGLATTAVVISVWRVRPEIIKAATQLAPIGRISIRKVIFVLLVVAAAMGGALSWFASSNPDGLEWSLLKATGNEEPAEPQKEVHIPFATIQEKTAFLPDYDFKNGKTEPKTKTPRSWPEVDAGTTISGLVGGVLTLSVTGLIGYLLRRRRKGDKQKS